MSNRATDGATVADLRVADVAGGVCEQRNVLLEHRRGLDLSVVRECADGDVVTGVTNVRQVGDAADVDEQRRRGQTQLHERQEAVATGQELGLIAGLGDQADGFLGGGSTLVIERCGNHCGSLVPTAQPLAQARMDLTMLW